MENIYEILKKHFQNETSSEEEVLVNEFKKKNSQEYHVLKQLWQSNATINVKEFDSNAAWKNVIKQATKQKRPVIPMFSKIRRIAAIAVILIASAFTFYYITLDSKPKELMAATSQHEKGNEIVLNDGSKIWLNKNSQLSYPETFKGKIRKVSLDGEAFFDIAKNPDKPFIIECNNAEVTVLGTSFNINTDSLETEISVKTGTVKVQSSHNQEYVTLLPNFMASVGHSTITKSQITNPNYLSWKTGEFLFKDSPIEKVVYDLNTFYNKPIVIKNQKTTCSFSASFDNANLADIIEILQLSCNLSIKETPNFYEIN